MRRYIGAEITELGDDGTFVVKVDTMGLYDKVKRILLECGNYGTLFYPDEDQQEGEMKDYTELINRLLAYAADRKGKIAELTKEAADAIKELTDHFADVRKMVGDDLISRKSVLDSLDYRQMKFAELGPEYFTELRKGIRGLPAMEREEWISVEDALPDFGDDGWLGYDGHFYSQCVLVCYAAISDGALTVAGETAICRDDGVWYWYVDDDKEESIVKITHWRPLPAPPTEGTK